MTYGHIRYDCGYYIGVEGRWELIDSPEELRLVVTQCLGRWSTSEPLWMDFPTIGRAHTCTW